MSQINPNPELSATPIPLESFIEVPRASYVDERRNYRTAHHATANSWRLESESHTQTALSFLIGATQADYESQAWKYFTDVGQKVYSSLEQLPQPSLSHLISNALSSSNFVTCIDYASKHASIQDLNRSNVRAITLLKIIFEYTSSADAQHRFDPVQAEPSWLLESIELQKKGLTEEAIDTIYERLDDLLCEHNYYEVDSCFQRMDSDKIPLDILLSVLTVTAHASDELPNRGLFFARAKKALSQRGELEEGLLDGLE